MQCPDVLLVLGSTAAEDAGRVTGTVLFLLISLLGLIKCVSIMKRPTTSSLCVLSLALFLLGWIVAAIAGHLREGASESGIWVGLLGMLVLGLLVASLVIAVVGLSLYDKNRFTQGRKQAIWALVLCSLFAVAVISMVAVKAAAQAAMIKPVKTSRAAGEAMVRKEFNFSLSPGEVWQELDPKVINAQACIALRVRNPEVFGVVIAERSEFELNQDLFCEIVKTNLSSASTVIRQSEEEKEINGLKFRRIMSRARLKTEKLTLDYEHWVATRGGYAWQVIAWSAAGEDHLRSLSKELIASFRLLDPEANIAAASTVENVDRPEFGYRTKIDTSEWAPWDGNNANALFDFRAQRQGEIVVVLPLMLESPPPMAVLTKGLLSSFDLEDVAVGEFRVNAWDPGGGGQGRELVVDREADGDQVRYVMRIARMEGAAYLIGGWVLLPKGDIAVLRRAMDAVELFKPAGLPPEPSKGQQHALGLVFNEFGISCSQRGMPEEATEWFERGFSMSRDPVMLGNLGDAMEQADQAEKGRDLMAAHVDGFPDNLYAGLCYARLLALAGDVDDAGERFIQLLDVGLKDEDDLLSWLQLINRLEQYPLAIRCGDEWVKRQPSINARLWLAQTHSASGDDAKAIELLVAMRQEFPDNLQVAYTLGESYNEDGRSAEAEGVAKSILKEVEGSQRAWMILGWSQMARKWYRDAKQSFERAAETNPEDEEVKEAIRRASAQLGQGENTDVRQPIEPVAIPAELQKTLAAVKVPDGAGSGQSAVWERYATGYSFTKGKPLKRTLHRRARILTADGAREFSSMSCSFNPLGERVFLNRLVVLDEQGKVLHEAGAGDIYVRDEHDGTASDKKVLHAQVAGVRPGVVVEWMVTVEDRSTADEFEFDRDLFVTALESQSQAVFVVGDVDQVAASTWQGESLEEVKGKRMRGWVCGHQPANKIEPYSVPYEHRCPTLWLGPAGATWKGVGDEYLGQIHDRLVPTAAVNKLAAEIVGERKGLHERVAAVMAYVRAEVVYQAIEFGVRGRRPNASEKTLELRYGDCKDMAVLVLQLLDAVGIKSHLALVNTEWDVESGIASLDQFNHMVVHVPALGADWLLDPTDKFLSQPEQRADSLWATRALVVEPSASRLIKLPSMAAEGSSKVASKRSVTLDGSDWQVKETLELGGYYASWMRGGFSGLSGELQHRKAQGILADLGNAQLHEFRFENLDDPRKPARLVLDYTVRRGVTEVGGHAAGAVPAFWEGDYLATSFVKDRKWDYRLIYPLVMTSEVEVRLPAGAVPSGLDTWAVNQESKFCKWQTSAAAEGEMIRLRMDFEASTGRWPAASYGKFHDAWEDARQAWEKPLAWKVLTAVGEDKAE